jgi:hypothetical protein
MSLKLSLLKSAISPVIVEQRPLIKSGGNLLLNYFRNDKKK